MEIKETTTKTYIVTGAERLDPITIMLTDFERLGHGKITIECYGKSWTGIWGSMGTGIADFFTSCNNSYLIGKMSNERHEIQDPEWVYDGEGDYEPDMIPNPEYEYLNRIIDAVKMALGKIAVQAL